MRLAYVSVEQHGPVPVARVEGEVDLSNIDETRETLLSAASSAPGLVLDLGSVAYLDSAGVRLLFDLERRLRELGRRLVVVVPVEASVRRVLDVARVDAAVEIESSVAGALARFELPAR